MSIFVLYGSAIAMICSPIYILGEPKPAAKKEMTKKETKKKKKKCNCGG